MAKYVDTCCALIQRGPSQKISHNSVFTQLFRLSKTVALRLLFTATTGYKCIFNNNNAPVSNDMVFHG